MRGASERRNATGKAASSKREDDGSTRENTVPTYLPGGISTRRSLFTGHRPATDAALGAWHWEAVATIPITSERRLSAERREASPEHTPQSLRSHLMRRVGRCRASEPMLSFLPFRSETNAKHASLSLIIHPHTHTPAHAHPPPPPPPPHPSIPLILVLLIRDQDIRSCT